MDETLRVIDQLIAEHKTIGEKTQTLEKAANDVRLISGLKDVGEMFVRGALPQDADLKNLAQVINFLDAWLDKHFSREEKVLRPAVRHYGNDKLVESLNALLFEHGDLRDRLLHARMHIDELLGGSLDILRRDAVVRDLKEHIHHSRKLLETHATQENHFLTEFRRYLKKAARGKEK